MLLGDQGSGAWLGLEALRHTAEVFDGFAPESPLSSAVKERLGQSMFEISVWSEKATAKDYAALAPTVFALATRGDPVSLCLQAKGAAAITRLARGLLSRGIERLVLLGGLARFYGALVDSDVRGRLLEPAADALDGAILMAGGRITP